MNGSPRKPLGLLNSPIRFGNGTPSQILSQDDPSSILDIATEEVQESVERSPQRSLKPIGNDVIGLSPSVIASKGLQRPKQGRKRPFEISPDKEEEDASVDLRPELQYGESSLDNALAANGNDGDDRFDIPSDDEPQSEDEPEEIRPAKPAPKPKAKRGRPKAKREEDLPVADVEQELEEQLEPELETQVDVEEEIPEVAPETPVSEKRRPGRPPKAAKQAASSSKAPAVYRDPDESVDGPSKPAKRSKVDTTAAPIASTPVKQRLPTERDPNALIKSKKNKDKVTASPPPSMPPPPKPSTVAVRGKPGVRSLQILLSTTPADADAARFTRSGRASVKPVEYWRGERIIYTEPKREGKRISLPGIKEVIRAEDLPEEPRPRSKRRAPGKRKAPVEEEIDDVDEDAEDWELDPGLLEGEVLQWDPDAQRARQDVQEQIGMYQISPQEASTPPNLLYFSNSNHSWPICDID